MFSFVPRCHGLAGRAGDLLFVSGQDADGFIGRVGDTSPETRATRPRVAARSTCSRRSTMPSGDSVRSVRSCRCVAT